MLLLRLVLLSLLVFNPLLANSLEDSQKREVSQLEGEFGGLPVIFRTPETGFAGGAVLIYVPQSSVYKKPAPIISGFMYSEKKQSLWALGTKQYVDATGRAMFVYSEFIDFPKKFFGIGDQNQKEDEEDYLERRKLIEFGFEQPLFSHLKLGLGGIIRRDELKQEEGSLASGDIHGSEGGKQVGALSYLYWETVDDVFYPQTGERLTLTHYAYPSSLGSDYPFSMNKLDLRIYRPLWEDIFLAARLYGISQSDNVPVYQMAQLGGHSTLRGYFKGQYRNRALLIAEAELRLKFSKYWAFTLFAGRGAVKEHWSHMSWDDSKPSVGAGARYQLSPKQKINLRLDVSIGDDRPQVYLYVLEAF